MAFGLCGAFALLDFQCPDALTGFAIRRWASMLRPVGFWSYTRRDDSDSDGQLSRLRLIVGKAISLRLGEDVRLFQDTEGIPLGADWAADIQKAISEVTFFIPLVTPAFLRSKHCCDEFRAFRRRMAELGRHDLSFPIHYVDVDHLDPEDTVFGEDFAELQRSNWIDFRPLRYMEPQSAEVRKWADRLAASVLAAMRRAAPPAAELQRLATAAETERTQMPTARDGVRPVEQNMGLDRKRSVYGTLAKSPASATMMIVAVFGLAAGSAPGHVMPLAVTAILIGTTRTIGILTAVLPKLRWSKYRVDDRDNPPYLAWLEWAALAGVLSLLIERATYALILGDPAAAVDFDKFPFRATSLFAFATSLVISILCDVKLPLGHGWARRVAEGVLCGFAMSVSSLIWTRLLNYTAVSTAGNGPSWFPWLFSFTLGFVCGLFAPHIYRRALEETSDRPLGSKAMQQ
jgi:hypothetical protein